MWYLSHMLENATKEIYITDWWFTPEIILRRPTELHDDKDWALDAVLKRKAEEGVQIYLQVFGGVGATMLDLGNDRVEKLFKVVKEAYCMCRS